MNASAQVIYWRDIPAQVRVRKGTERFSLPLSTRFQEAIDAAAVQSGLTGTDAYLEQWHNSPWQPYDGEPEEIAAMLSDENVSDAARETARELFDRS